MVTYKKIRKSILFLVIFCFAMAADARAMPSFQQIKDSYKKSDAVLLDRHGKVIHELRTDPAGRRLDWTSLKDISPSLIKAVIQSEDKRFFEHQGVDWKAVASAAVKNLFAKTPRGASTITMQLVPFLDNRLKPKGIKRKTLGQKWDQMQAAKYLEKTWTKDEVLEAYLGLITFRGELQGTAAASRGLFDKEPSGLDGPEALILASLIRSPNARPEDVAKRACLLREAMKAGASCEDIRRLAQKVLSGPYSVKQAAALAPHLARSLLKGGRTSVASTLDGDLQSFASEVLKRQLLAVKVQNVNDGAVLIAENKTGEVLAYVASSGEVSSAANVDGIRAKRQAGSTLKPFLYALAFEKKMLTPASVLKDSPLDVPTATGIYKPEDYDNDYKGAVSARTALASSLNIPAVSTLSLIGEEDFVSRLRHLGFGQLKSNGYYGPSLALGSADVSLYELVNAYRALVNNGIWSELRVTPQKDKGHKRRVYSEDAVFLVSDILSDREARSATFSLENPLSTRFWSAVKTGTSKDMRDNWCIGYSEKYTVGVWVGNFSGEPMWDVSGVTGAAPVWLEIMEHLHKDGPVMSRRLPGGVIARKVKFNNSWESGKMEWFIRGTEPWSEEIKEMSAAYVPRIAYPVKGMIIALDPDIPMEQQRVFFEVNPVPGSYSWRLNNKHLGKSSETISWRPTTGDYILSLVDPGGRIVDSVDFKVRGD